MRGLRFDKRLLRRGLGDGLRLLSRLGLRRFYFGLAHRLRLLRRLGGGHRLRQRRGLRGDRLDLGWGGGGSFGRSGGDARGHDGSAAGAIDRNHQTRARLNLRRDVEAVSAQQSVGGHAVAGGEQCRRLALGDNDRGAAFGAPVACGAGGCNARRRRLRR